MFRLYEAATGTSTVLQTVWIEKYLSLPLRKPCFRLNNSQHHWYFGRKTNVMPFKFLSPFKTGQTLLYARQLEKQDANSRSNKNHICKRKISATESSNQTLLSSTTSAALQECYSLWQLHYFPCNKPTCNVVPSETFPSDSAWQAPRLTLPRLNFRVSSVLCLLRAGCSRALTRARHSGHQDNTKS